MMASVRPVGGSTFRKRIEAGVDRSWEGVHGYFLLHLLGSIGIADGGCGWDRLWSITSNASQKGVWCALLYRFL